MSIDVSKFLEGNNFTENAPRPPVPGEENELCSTKSSGSRHSQQSSKSGKSLSSPLVARRAESITPSAKGCSDGEDETRSGWIEGSVSNSPPFTETSTPAFKKWAEDLTNLLADGDGVQLFKRYLKQEKCDHILEFYFACQGLKSQDKVDERTLNLIKAIYKKYIRGEPSITLKADVKQAILNKITNKSGMDRDIFDDAQQEIECSMKTVHFPMFLKSDLYVQYIQTGGESPQSSASTSGSNSARPLSQALPTLHEDAELTADNLTESRTNSNVQVTLPLTKDFLKATASSRCRTDYRKPEAHAGAYLHSQNTGRVQHPYYTSYAPVSAVDSELQSLSSDALTDDTMSQTDSSVDGYSTIYRNKRHLRHHRRSMQASAMQNRDTQLPTFIPRTDPGRVPKDRNTAETDPDKFAKILIEKLETVLREREAKDRVHEKISTIHSESEESEIEMRRNLSKVPTTQPFNALLAAMKQISQPDDNAQSILEDHCSRVWASSAQQTPSRSPGLHSPRAKSPHRRSQAAHSKTKNLSYYSLDSGMSDEYTERAVVGGATSVPGETHIQKHIHQHHHHHYYDKQPAPRKLQDLEKYAQQKASYHHVAEGGAGGGSGRGRTTKRMGIRKGSDTSSNIDSGVSMVYEREPQLTASDWSSNPSNEKVLSWMMENDKIAHASSPYPDSDKGSHKRSHKSSSSTCASPSPLQHRQGSSSKPGKQPVQYSASRSGSLDRGGLAVPDVTGLPVVRPHQPFIQDPNMPMMTPPNSTTQLEEVKRRLEDSKSRQLAKSKSFAGPVSKDKRQSPVSHSSIPQSTQRLTPSGSAQFEQDTSSKKISKKSSSQQSISTSSTPSLETTKIAYFFCGDPIPYTVSVQSRDVTLSQFKSLISKKGDYKFFFKKASDEFGTGVVHEEVSEDSELLPLWEGKIIARVEKKE